jgi:transcriptional regulator with XRE-family HTH domain
MAAARAALGVKLREQRDKKGLTQQQVADAAGVDRSLYARWESGERGPNYKQWHAIAQFYGILTMALMPRNQYPALPIDPVERGVALQARNEAIAAGGLQRKRD